MVCIRRCCPESFRTFGGGYVSSTRRNLLHYGIGRSSCVIPSTIRSGKCPYCFPGCCHRAVRRNMPDGSICIQEPHNRCCPIVGLVLNLSRGTNPLHRPRRFNLIRRLYAHRLRFKMTASTDDWSGSRFPLYDWRYLTLTAIRYPGSECFRLSLPSGAAKSLYRKNGLGS